MEIHFYALHEIYPILFRTENAERDFREAERKKLTPTVTTLKRTRYYTTRHNGICVTTEIKEYTKKTTYVYAEGDKPPELDNISLKSDCVQEKNKIAKKFTPIGNDELDAILQSDHPFDMSKLDSCHTGIYNLKNDSKGGDTSSFTSKDFNITSQATKTSDTSTSDRPVEYETALNHPAEPLKFVPSDRESPGPDTCKVNRLSYNQALKDSRVSLGDGSSATSSSSSSTSSTSKTFKDTDDEKSTGTHRSSLLPNFFNFCKGPDTKSIDSRNQPDSPPKKSKKKQSLVSSHSLTSSTSSTSIKVDKGIGPGYIPHHCGDHSHGHSPSLEASRSRSDASKDRDKPKSSKDGESTTFKKLSHKPSHSISIAKKPTSSQKQKKKKPKRPMCPPFGKKPDVHSPPPPRPKKHASADKPKIEPEIIKEIPLTQPEYPNEVSVDSTLPVDSIHQSTDDYIPVLDVPKVGKETIGVQQSVPDSGKKSAGKPPPSVKSLPSASVTSKSLISKEVSAGVVKVPSIDHSPNIKSLPTKSITTVSLHTKSKSAASVPMKSRSSTPKLREPLDVHPKAVILKKKPSHDKRKPKKRPFSLCGNQLPSGSESPDKEKQKKPKKRPMSCFSKQPSETSTSSVSSDKDDTIADGESLSSDDSFAMSSSLIRPKSADPSPKLIKMSPIKEPEKIPRQLKVGINGDGTLKMDDDGNLLDPDGNPLVYVGPTGGEGKPLFKPELGPVIGPDGTVYDPYGKPILNKDGLPVKVGLRPCSPRLDSDTPDRRPLTPDLNRNVLGPDHLPVTDDKGEPIKCPEVSSCPYVDPEGLLYGPNGKPIIDPETKLPIKIKLNPDNSIPIDDDKNILDPDGKPFGDPDHPLKLGSDIPGPIIAPDGTVLSPEDGKPILDSDGNPVKAAMEDPETSSTPTDSPSFKEPRKPDEQGNILNENGKPVVGPDMKPIKCPVISKPVYIDPEDVIHGPDGKPIIDPDTKLPIKIKLNPDNSILIDDNKNILDPDGKPIGDPENPLKLGLDIPGPIIAPDGTVLSPEDGKPILDSDGNPVKAALTPSMEPPLYRPRPPDDNGNILDAEGNPVLGPDGEPIKCPTVAHCPYIDPSGVLHNADGKPAIDPETGKPIKINLGPDSTLPTNDNGDPVDENGKPIGELPAPIVTPDGHVISPVSGKPILDPDNRPHVTSPPGVLAELPVNEDGELLDRNGNPIIDPDSGKPVRPTILPICPYISPEGDLYDIAGDQPLVTYDEPPSLHTEPVVEEPKYAAPPMTKPLGRDTVADLQGNVDIPSIKSSVAKETPSKEMGVKEKPSLTTTNTLKSSTSSIKPPPRPKKKSKPWSGCYPCARKQTEPKKDKKRIPESSNICSETPTSKRKSSTSTSSKSKTSKSSKNAVNELLDKVRGRKSKPVTNLRRSVSIPASLYSSQESLIEVTYVIRRRRGQSAPPQAKKRRPTRVKINCGYGNTPALISPMYVADVVGAFKATETTLGETPDLVDYHENIVDKLKEYKKNPEKEKEREHKTESHIYTTCFCEKSQPAARLSVGISTNCDIIQHEQGPPVPIPEYYSYVYQHLVSFLRDTISDTMRLSFLIKVYRSFRLPFLFFICLYKCFILFLNLFFQTLHSFSLCAFSNGPFIFFVCLFKRSLPS